MINLDRRHIEYITRMRTCGYCIYYKELDGILKVGKCLKKSKRYHDDLRYDDEYCRDCCFYATKILFEVLK